MKAILIEEYGGPEVLLLREIPDLTPGTGEVRVRVAATALNRADLLQRRGAYPQPGAKAPYEIPGLEFAGTIDRLGPGVEGWAVGDRVCGLLPGGGYAEQVVTPARMLLRIPAGLSFVEAAALPEVFFTAYDALVARANLRMGDNLLIHAGGSGVGTAAIQLARAMGAQVFATFGSAEKASAAMPLGVTRSILYREERFEEVLLQETQGRGADVIIDFVGAPYLERNLRAAATGARVVLVGTLGGNRAELPLGVLMAKRISLVGTVLRSRPVEEKLALTQAVGRHCFPLFESGQLRPVVDRIFPLTEVADAHRYMEENKNFGKILLELS